MKQKSREKTWISWYATLVHFHLWMRASKGDEGRRHKTRFLFRFDRLGRSYGKLMRDLLNAGPVWAVDSPANRDCAEQLWAKFPARDHLDGASRCSLCEPAIHGHSCGWEHSNSAGSRGPRYVWI